MIDTRVLREFVGWWPVTVTLDGEPVTDGSLLTMVCLPQEVRPEDDLVGFVWKPGHIDDEGNLCVWLDAVEQPTRMFVYVRPTPVSPEDPVYVLDGAIFRT